MSDIVKQIIARPIQLADQVVKASEYVCSFKQDCAEIKAKTEKLASLLRQVARVSNDLYERPTRRIVDETEQALEKTLHLVYKCSRNGLRRVFKIIPNAVIRRTQQQLENSIGDVSWLLRVSTPSDDQDDEYLGLPPIAANEPTLCLIWEQIAILCSGTMEERAEGAVSLVSLARDNERYGKLIIEEGGVPPLLRLAKEGNEEGQENAARAIGLLGRNPESVEHIINSGVCAIFAKILKYSHMKVQLVVAWAVSELAANYPKCQEHFLQNNVIRLLVGHLAFETIQEHSRYAIASKQNMSIESVVMAKADTNPRKDGKLRNEEREKGQVVHPSGIMVSDMHKVVTKTMGDKSVKTMGDKSVKTMGDKSVKSRNDRPHYNKSNRKHLSLIGASIKARELEDPTTKNQMKAMAARALWYLCAGNVTICKSITESRALLCFAVLLEKGEYEIQYNSAMALTEITAVAEQHVELRHSGFKPTSPAARAVVDQFLKIIKNANSDFLVPSIQSIGHLARTFRATETRIIPPIVRLLENSETDVSTEAIITLIKFACPDNFLHVNHCKTIIDVGGSKHLIQLTYFGENSLQALALILLSYLAMHVPDSETLAQDEVLVVLEWALKQGHFTQDSTLETLVVEAKQRLEIYQSRNTRGSFIR
ncbi:putative armadillo-like helical protein [Helianthus annuus]|nr:putative armadillo-like helical protein [Helianthus annuus]KAJ0447709.1 putative adaptor protein Cbl domain superfamily [Helianthus annuus]KAJ0632609.1 putative adaptor protein Cbl domain superfamily [Helianthus annuus]KAJ0813382.1 putative armadillo-like helical protein [Helianthus annuus]KAJ0826524.1 putative armadillo-like helical protein [Helianthus annuus]